MDTLQNPFTSGIARFVAALDFDDIPPEVISRIKLLILDALGCAVFGARLEWSRILVETLAGMDSTPGCAVWGTDCRLSAPQGSGPGGVLSGEGELLRA